MPFRLLERDALALSRCEERIKQAKNSNKQKVHKKMESAHATSHLFAYMLFRSPLFYFSVNTMRKSQILLQNFTNLVVLEPWNLFAHVYSLRRTSR